MVLILIFLKEITVNSYVLRSTPTIININTVLQGNQSCSNPNAVPCIRSEVNERVGLPRMEVEKSGSSGLNSWPTLWTHPFVSCEGGVTPIFGLFCRPCLDMNWVLWKKGAVSIQSISVWSDELWSMLRGLNSQSQFATLFWSSQSSLL